MNCERSGSNFKKCKLSLRKLFIDKQEGTFKDIAVVIPLSGNPFLGGCHKVIKFFN